MQVYVHIKLISLFDNVDSANTIIQPFGIIFTIHDYNNVFYASVADLGLKIETSPNNI